MAQRIYGIDLGSYAVKIAVIELGFQKRTLTQVVEVPLIDAVVDAVVDAPPVRAGADDGESPPPARGAAQVPDGERRKAALREALRRVGGRPDVAVLGMPGQQSNFRQLDFPFSDERRVVQVLAYELDEQIPYDIDDVVYDYLLDVEPKEAGAQVLVAFAKTDIARSYVELAQGAGVDPEILTASPLSYGYLFANEGQPQPQTDPEVVGVVDIGHAGTNFAVVRWGHMRFVRTISRGGKAVTEAVAKRLSISFGQAQQIKHTEGDVPHPSAAVTAERAELVGAISAEVAQLTTRLRQTLLHLRGQPKLMPERLVLCGGGSKLRGLAEHLSRELEMGVTTSLPTASGVRSREHAVPVGLAYLGDRRTPTVNLRQGELSKGQRAGLIRRKIHYFSWAAVIILGLLVINGFTSLAKLRKEHKVLRQRLAQKTREIFKRSIDDPALVQNRIRRALRRKRVTSLPIPESSAYAILSEISRRVPDKKKVTLDITMLDIRPKKIGIDGTAKTASEVEEVQKALAQIACFKKVDLKRTVEITVEKEKRRKFTMEVKHTCM